MFSLDPVLNCSVTPLEIKYKNAEGCVSIDKVNLRTCGGVCGMVPGICCQPTLTTRRQVEMQCNDQVTSETVSIAYQCMGGGDLKRLISRWHVDNIYHT